MFPISPCCSTAAVIRPHPLQVAPIVAACGGPGALPGSNCSEGCALQLAPFNSVCFYSLMTDPYFFAASTSYQAPSFEDTDAFYAACFTPQPSPPPPPAPPAALAPAAAELLLSPPSSSAAHQLAGSRVSMEIAVLYAMLATVIMVL